MANTTVAYLATTVDQGYALDYVISQKTAIMDVAAKLNISAGAITGAMAEENTGYLGDQAVQNNKWGRSQLPITR